MRKILVLIRLSGAGAINFTVNSAVLTAAERLWHAGKTQADQFKVTYHPYFAAALAENPYAPEYAFVLACDRAGLPLDEWASEWPDELVNTTGYYLPESTLAKAS